MLLVFISDRELKCVPEVWLTKFRICDFVQNLPKYLQSFLLQSQADIPFTAAQITLFFQDQAYMSLTACTATALVAKGIAIPDDLFEFDKEGMELIFRNLHKPAKVLCAGAAGVSSELQEIMAYEMLARYQIRLMIGAAVPKFYNYIGCTLDPDNMMWTVIQCFHEQHKALLARKVGDSTYAPPKLTKNFSTYKWLELFVLCLCQKIGMHHCPLEYVVRDILAVPVVAPPLEPLKLHSIEHGGSIEGNMIARMSHGHPLFKAGNGAIFELIKNLVRGTVIAALIAPFCHTRDGCAAFMAIRAQHAGKDIWDKLHKEAESVLQTQKWSCTVNVTLAQHMGKHHQAYITLTECAEHIPVDVPNEHSRDRCLMESLNSVDPTVLAALAAICQDEQDKRVNVESAFRYLVVVCPIEAKLARNGKISFQVSGTESVAASGLGGNTKKPGFGTTGVPLWYHKHKDFVKLPKEQKDELTAWQKANAGKPGAGNKHSPGKQNNHATKKFKSMISALETRQNEVIVVMVDSQQAGVSAMLGGASPFVAKVACATTTVQSKDVLVEHAQVAALKFQGILKAGKKT